MRYPASEKLEIIHLVERSSHPAKWTLDRLGVQRRTFHRWYDRYLNSGEDGLVDRAATSRPCMEQDTGQRQSGSSGYGDRHAGAIAA